MRVQLQSRIGPFLLAVACCTVLFSSAALLAQSAEPAADAGSSDLFPIQLLGEEAGCDKPACDESDAEELGADEQVETTRQIETTEDSSETVVRLAAADSRSVGSTSVDSTSVDSKSANQVIPEPNVAESKLAAPQPASRITRLPTPKGRVSGPRKIELTPVEPKTVAKTLPAAQSPTTQSPTQPATPPVLQPQVAGQRYVPAPAANEPTARVASRTENPIDKLLDEQLKNRLEGPLSGKFDFEEPMEAVTGKDDSGWELPPSGSGSNALPPMVESQARRMLAEATSLADRGAIFAANREFLRVMRMITQSLDSQIGQQYHTRALAAGLRALEEADDFSLSSGDRVEDDVQIANFVKGHRTSVLKNADLTKMTSLRAIQRYYEFAREQLTIASGGTSLGSRALFALGRAESFLGTEKPNRGSGAPKSIAFFDAALQADPMNVRAGNELAVMLARRGRLQDAAAILEHGVKVAPSPMAVSNLAHILQRMGHPDAGSMRQQANQYAASGQIVQGPASRVTWVNPAAFSEISENPNALNSPVAQGSSVASSSSVAPSGSGTNSAFGVGQVNWNSPAAARSGPVVNPTSQPYGPATQHIRSALADPIGTIPMPRARNNKKPTNPAPVSSQWW